jgi:hypothetical protein
MPSHAFFLDAIKEIYDKGIFLSIYPKKKNIHIPLCVACNALHSWRIWCIFYRDSSGRLSSNPPPPLEGTVETNNVRALSLLDFTKSSQALARLKPKKAGN